MIVETCVQTEIPYPRPPLRVKVAGGWPADLDIEGRSLLDVFGEDWTVQNMKRGCKR